MPVYVYRGTNRSGSAVNGEQAANNKTELLNLLKRQQIKVSKTLGKGQGVQLPNLQEGCYAQGIGCVHAPILRDDRCRLASRAMS